MRDFLLVIIIIMCGVMFVETLRIDSMPKPPEDFAVTRAIVKLKQAEAVVPCK